MKGLGLALRRRDLDASAQADGAQPHLENPGSMPLATLPNAAMATSSSVIRPRVDPRTMA
jgi:hypothetical protein